MNIHHIVRRSISSILPDRHWNLYRSCDFESEETGETVPYYYSPTVERVQVQTESPTALFQADLGTSSSITRKVYMYADKSDAKKPYSGLRALGRSGDYLVDENGGCWFVSDVLEDFSQVGWVSLRVILQNGVVPSVIKKTGLYSFSERGCF